jgi:N-methylhydantoinase B/oxoprolinase/acetone carboxylase alpha subunit
LVNFKIFIKIIIDQLWFGTLKPGEFSYELDNGAIIKVKISIKQDEATIDFTGISEQQNNNFNAPAAVCKAAVLYVFRTLVQDDIPMNAGCLKPNYPAAIVAGNTNTTKPSVAAQEQEQTFMAPQLYKLTLPTHAYPEILEDSPSHIYNDVFLID